MFFSAFAFSCFTDLLLSWSFSLRKEAAFSLNSKIFSSCSLIIFSLLSEIAFKESFFAFSIILCFSASAFFSMYSDSSSEVLISFRISASFASCILGVEYIFYIKFLHLVFNPQCYHPVHYHLADICEVGNDAIHVFLVFCIWYFYMGNASCKFHCKLLVNL